MNERGGKRQVLYFDRTNILMDKKNEIFKALFTEVADVGMLESFPADHNNPLDHTIFGAFQNLFNRQLNSTEEEVKRAIEETIEKLTPEMVMTKLFVT
jgi:hypothetical protein